MEEGSCPCEMAQLVLAGREQVAICVGLWVAASKHCVLLTHTEFPKTQVAESPADPLCSFLCGDIIMGRWIN